MAFTSSGLYVQVYKNLLTSVALTGTGVAGAFYTLATSKIALHSNSLTQGTAPINYSAASPNWAATNEVTGTGWLTGGTVLNVAAAGAASTVPTLVEGTTGSIRYDMGDVAVSGTTLTNARGCIIYLDACTAPADMVDAMLVAVTFLADFSTIAGIFGIQWSATGIFEIDLTPP